MYYVTFVLFKNIEKCFWVIKAYFKDGHNYTFPDSIPDGFSICLDTLCIAAIHGRKWQFGSDHFDYVTQWGKTQVFGNAWGKYV